MWNQPNPNGPTAVFIARPDGTFRRFDAKTRKAWDAPREQGPIGTYGADGSMYIGVDPRMAMDAALDPNAGVPPMRPDRAAAIGASKQQQDQGGNGAISREHAASLHDLAHKANLPESDMQGFANVLAALTGGEQGPAARDRLGGGGGARKISRDQASQIYNTASSKLSPADCQKLVELLSGMIDENMANPDDEGQAQGQTGDMPPAFPGRPTPGGKITGDAALAAFKSEYGITAGHAPPYGEPVPKSSARMEAESARLALDERQTRGSGESALEAFNREWPSVARIGRSY